MAEVGSDKNPSCPPNRHFRTVSFSQQSMKTLWTAPDMSHHVLFRAFFKVVYCTFAPSPPELMEELCHSAQSLETRHCHLPGGLLSGNTALTYSLFFSQPLLR